MARKRKADKVETAAAHERWDGRALWRWFASLGAARRRLWLRRSLLAVVVGGLGVAIAVGLARVDRHVQAMTRYAGPLAFQVTGIPAWGERLGLGREVVASVAALGDSPFLDPTLVARIADRLSANPWVKRTVRVEKKYGRQIEIECEFRRPIAAVQTRGGTAWIDEEGVRLPVLERAEAPPFVVSGIRAAAPPAGHPWAGEDIATAVQMVGMLAGEPFADQITELSMRNYGGRVSRAEPHIVLLTDAENQLLWGSAPGHEVEEPEAAEKIALIHGMWRDHGRVDMGARWVNLMKGTNHVGRFVDLDGRSDTPGAPSRSDGPRRLMGR